VCTESALDLTAERGRRPMGPPGCVTAVSIDMAPHQQIIDACAVSAGKTLISPPSSHFGSCSAHTGVASRSGHLLEPHAAVDSIYLLQGRHF
jgi:hypothetical protein